jgi:hypothetical protein
LPLGHQSSVGELIQFLLLPALLIPAIFFLLSQQRTLQAVRKENQLMRPGLVWLQLIPIFGQCWQFFVVTRIAESISKGFSSWQDDSILGVSDPSVVEEFGKRPTFAIGITYCVLISAGITVNLFVREGFRFLFVGPIFTWSGMICWIIYWVQLVAYRRKLQVLQK